MSGDDKEALHPDGNLKMDEGNHRANIANHRFDVGDPRIDIGNHRFDFANHRIHGKPMRRSDIEHLAMLKAKAKAESGKFTCADFFKAMLFIGIVTAFTFVFYRIAVLKQEIDSVSSRVETVRHIALSEARNRPCNCTPSRRHEMYFGLHPFSDQKKSERRRRSASQTQQETDHDASHDNEIDSQPPPRDSGRFSAHLLATSDNRTLTPGQLFNWTDSKDHSFIQPGGFELIQDQYLFVPVAGYYFVYSQITFNDSLTRTVGHQVVTWGRCGGGSLTILMGTSLTQQNRPANNFQTSKPQDSSYLGGMVYLAAGDFIAVRPSFDAGTNNIEYARLDTNTFFGAFLINRDTKGPSVKVNCAI